MPRRARYSISRGVLEFYFSSGRISTDHRCHLWRNLKTSLGSIKAGLRLMKGCEDSVLNASRCPIHGEASLRPPNSLGKTVALDAHLEERDDLGIQGP